MDVIKLYKNYNRNLHMKFTGQKILFGVGESYGRRICCKATHLNNNHRAEAVL